MCHASSLSPARLVANICPLLNTHFLWRCLGAYIGIRVDNRPLNSEVLSKVTTSDAIASDGEQQLNAATSTSSPTAPDTKTIHRAQLGNIESL